VLPSSCGIAIGDSTKSCGCPPLLDIMVLHVFRCWMSCCYMCADARYHSATCIQLAVIMALLVCRIS
jgi:hypothetical protein